LPGRLFGNCDLVDCSIGRQPANRRLSEYPAAPRANLPGSADLVGRFLSARFRLLVRKCCFVQLKASIQSQISRGVDFPFL